MTNQKAGEIIGWGDSQSAEGIAQTENQTQNRTAESVQEMVEKGLTKAKAEKLAAVYADQLAEGMAEKNLQLAPRFALMQKILALWPGK